MNAGTRATLVSLATYNEIDNLPELVQKIFQQLPEAHIVVVDDNSPDGTGTWCARQAADDRRLHCIHRPCKMGLGSATLAAIQYAVQHDYDLLVNMDADLSHDPASIPSLIDRITEPQRVDVVIGSRYVRGGRIEGWPLRRRILSRAVNCGARLLLGLAPRDCSGAFRCFRVQTLRKLDKDSFRSTGYAFEEELLWRLKQVGAQFAEVPITFRDRRQGHSKADVREMLSAGWTIFSLGLINWFRLRPKKLFRWRR